MSSMSSSNSAASPGWMRPDEVMKIRKLKAKRHALHARMKSAAPLQILVNKSDVNTATTNVAVKRKNPFRQSPNKIARKEAVSNVDEGSSDSTLFQFLNPSQTTARTVSKPVYSFANILKNNLEHTEEKQPSQLWCDNLIVDWSLKTRLRFCSSKPLPWKHTFKTSEEASGTTGFVRCVSSGRQYSDDACCLDTSNNAKFYQSCLTWQHPNIPWLQTFPRDSLKLSSQTGIFGSDPKLANSLKAEWSESLRSLHQLLRVRQCPYFYVCGPSFTCLFRAAGVGSVSHAHALITPTTRGFRDAMKDDGVSYKMPFLDTKTKQEGKDNDDSDAEEVDEQADAGGEEATSFLQDLGVEASQFPHLDVNRTRVENKKYKSIDSSPLSLVYIEDMDLMGLTNFLLNCTSCTATTGPLAGIPPTLISPVAFHGATLKQLKVKGGIIKLEDGTSHNSMELSGPIMPQTLLELTNLLTSLSDSFSISLNHVVSTVPFCRFSVPEDVTAPQAFAKEGLVDCGLDSTVRTQICLPPNNEEDIKSKLLLPNFYKDIQYKNNQYTWS